MIRNIYIILLSVIIEIIALFLALVSMGGGHGHYFMAKMFFPLEMIIGTAIETLAGIPVLMALIHYPLIMGISTLFNTRNIIIYYIIMAFIHAALVCILFLMGGSQFS
jgi:hypothetical protein